MTEQEILAQMDNLYSYLNAKEYSYNLRKRVFNFMCNLYNQHPFIRKVWDFCENAHALVKRFVKRVKSKIAEIAKAVTNGKPLLIAECEVLRKPCAYILEFFDGSDRFMNLKIGKADDMLKRAKAYGREYPEHRKCVIKKLFYCEDSEDALSMENALRKFYKSKENCGFIRNDRFSGCRYSETDLLADEKVQMAMELYCV